ncbi:MAG: efflux RND transporter periplasmic adaptor subunit [Pirellulales bacterium]
MVRTIPLLLAAALLIAGGPRLAAVEVQVSSVLVKLIEQVDVPAREAGALEKVTAREGDMVEAGASVAQIEDAAARFDKRHAELELAAARKEADSDVKVRFARKSLEVAEAELRRALDSERRFAKSVSQSELDHLRLSVQKTTLEIEQAQLEQDLAQAASELKQVDVDSAEHAIRQRHITAPLSGFIAEVNRHQGEWVEPGQPILRILRLDRLRAEGLASAGEVNGELKGRKATLTVEIAGQPTEFVGTVTYVSPEVDPVNGQVRIWAEIENPRLQLRPGLHGSMVIGDAAPQSASR